MEMVFVAQCHDEETEPQSSRDARPVSPSRHVVEWVCRLGHFLLH